MDKKSVHFLFHYLFAMSDIIITYVGHYVCVHILKGLTFLEN